jgi:hypothetical protein
MPLWGNKDQANNAPKYKILPNSTANGSVLFGTQVVGIDDGETTTRPGVAHAGWQRVERGTGPVSTIVVSAAGSGYNNTDVVRVSGGTVNALANVVTNGSGGITAVNIFQNGTGFVNNSTITTTVAVSNTGAASAGTGATLTVTLGGRANRVFSETLITQSNMTANNSTI